MNTFVANIDERNLNLFNEASKKSGIEYEKGVKMTSTINDEKDDRFYPIFCESIDEAAILIEEYSAIKAQSTNFGKDLILHQVLVKLLRF